MSTNTNTNDSRTVFASLGSIIVADRSTRGDLKIRTKAATVAAMPSNVGLSRSI
jgi:hypothetical protein